MATKIICSDGASTALDLADDGGGSGDGSGDGERWLRRGWSRWWRWEYLGEVEDGVEGSL